MKMHRAYMCKECGKFKTKDGEFVKLSAFESMMMSVNTDRIFVEMVICEECRRKDAKTTG